MTPEDMMSQERLDAEVRHAVRFEQGLALKLLVSLAVVALVVVIRLLVV